MKESEQGSLVLLFSGSVLFSDIKNVLSAAVSEGDRKDFLTAIKHALEEKLTLVTPTKFCLVLWRMMFNASFPMEWYECFYKNVLLILIRRTVIFIINFSPNSLIHLCDFFCVCLHYPTSLTHSISHSVSFSICHSVFHSIFFCSFLRFSFSLFFSLLLSLFTIVFAFFFLSNRLLALWTSIFLKRIRTPYLQLKIVSVTWPEPVRK